MRDVRCFTGNQTCLVALTLASMLALWPIPAQAQDRDHIVLGVGVAATPAYQGADDYRLSPFPAIDIKKGWFFANLRNGIGIEPIDSEAVTVGAGAVLIQGYRNRDVPDGIDKLSSGVGVRLFATVRAAGFVATLGATKVISGGTEGMITDASLSYPIKISSRFKLTPTIGASWANRKHNEGYFGVTDSESLASGLPQFTAASGFKDASALLTASYRLTDRITVSATGGVASLLGKVNDSPLVVHKTQPSGIIALSYRF
jgi:outer membrane protein